MQLRKQSETKRAAQKAGQLKVGVAGVSVVVVAMAGLCIGPSSIGLKDALCEVLSHIPGVPIESNLSPLESSVIWQIRAPRVVLALLVGGMLALCGAAYQGVFRNPLADPYLLGSAAGAGLGATIAIAFIDAPRNQVVPAAAFIGSLLAVFITYCAAMEKGLRSTTALILAGVAVTSLFTALQTFIQQQQTDVIREVYSWILGRLSSANWDDVALMAPYALVSAVVILVHRRVLDAMTVGDDEAHSLGVNVNKSRLIVVIAASLGTAAAVSVSGLIGFVGIIVPHLIRLLIGGSYRNILPFALVFGGSFMVVADLIARQALAPAEIPIGVITATIGAPFFVLIMRMRRA